MISRLGRRAEIQLAIDPMTDEELTAKWPSKFREDLDAMSDEEIARGRAEDSKSHRCVNRVVQIKKIAEDFTPEEAELIAEKLEGQFALAVRWSKIHARREGRD